MVVCAPYHDAEFRILRIRAVVDPDHADPVLNPHAVPHALYNLSNVRRLLLAHPTLRIMTATPSRGYARPMFRTNAQKTRDDVIAIQRRGPGPLLLTSMSSLIDPLSLEWTLPLDCA